MAQACGTPAEVAAHDASAIGALQCVQCPIGSFSAAGAGDDPMCDACPAGRYSDSTGATECKACPVGTVGIGRRATSVEEGCVPCANGTFSLAEAATACMACPTEVELDDEGEEIPPPDGCPPVDSAAAAPSCWSAVGTRRRARLGAVGDQGAIGSGEWTSWAARSPPGWPGGALGGRVGPPRRRPVAREPSVYTSR